MRESPTRLFAPFSATQVEALNFYQQSGVFHPFTCGGDDCGQDLVATQDGWVCPRCLYPQNWAFVFMADREGIAQRRAWIEGFSMADARKPVIYVDLDATLNQYDGWKGEGHFPALRPGALEFLTLLRAQGFDLKLFTARASLPAHKRLVEHWLEGSPLAGLFLGVTCEKGYDAHLFVDDRAVPFRGDYGEVLDHIATWQHVQ